MSNFTQKSSVPITGAIVSYMKITPAGLVFSTVQAKFRGSFPEFAAHLMKAGMTFTQGEHTVIITPSAIMSIEKGERALVQTH